MVLPKVSHLVNHMNFHYIMDYFFSFALGFSFGYPKTIYSCQAWGGSILVAVYAVNDAKFNLMGQKGKIELFFSPWFWNPITTRSLFQNLDSC